jgi:anti-sigma factor RsiW
VSNPGGPRHYGEELQDLLDGRLDEPRRAEVEAHVADCARCRRELDALRWVKSEVSKQDAVVEPTAELSSRIRAALDTPQRASRWSGMTRRVWIVGALAAAALLAVFLRSRKSPSLPSLVASDFAAYQSGTLKLDYESADPKAVETHFARNGVRFATHVYDLGMMNYRLAGGRVHRLDGRTSALFAYRGPGDSSLVCQMYEGTATELPPTDDVREHNRFTFYVYRSGNVTTVFWQEDGVMCVLSSDAPLEDVVQLAFAKAMRVQPTTD